MIIKDDTDANPDCAAGAIGQFDVRITPVIAIDNVITIDDIA